MVLFNPLMSSSFSPSGCLCQIWRSSVTVVLRCGIRPRLSPAWRHQQAGEKAWPWWQKADCGQEQMRGGLQDYIHLMTTNVIILSLKNNSECCEVIGLIWGFKWNLMHIILHFVLYISLDLPRFNVRMASFPKFTIVSYIFGIVQVPRCLVAGVAKCLGLPPDEPLTGRMDQTEERMARLPQSRSSRGNVTNKVEWTVNLRD